MKTGNNNAARVLNSEIHPQETPCVSKVSKSPPQATNGAGSKCQGGHHREQRASSEEAKLAVHGLKCYYTCKRMVKQIMIVIIQSCDTTCNNATITEDYHLTL